MDNSPKDNSPKGNSAKGNSPSVETRLAASPSAQRTTQRSVTTLTVPTRHFLDNRAMTLFRNRYRVESVRLADWDYSECGWYFVTICTRDKKCLLGKVSDGRVALSQGGSSRKTNYEASRAITQM